MTLRMIPGARGLVVAALLPALGLVASLARAEATETTVLLCDFENDAAVAAWDVNSGATSLAAEGATQGGHALQVRFDPRGPYHPAYLSWKKPRADWSGYDALALDVTNPSAQPMAGYVLIADRAWADKGRTYWNRHNATRSLPPGRSTWLIPVRGLYRGEAGSRNNDIREDVDASRIVRVDFGFGAKGAEGRVLVDNLRLIRAGRPAGAWAFDFGPPSQAVMPGWLPVAHDTRYAKERGYGWGPQGGTPWNGAARDTTFGPMLTRDFCEAGGYRFRVDAPPGEYRVTVIYENSGYWGGEQAQQRERRILVNGQPAWSDARPDGSAHALYRFEDVDPVGADIWDTYMAPELARPVTFTARVGRDGLTLAFESDKPWGSKLSALALCAASDEAACDWLAGQLRRVAAEFRELAQCLDPPAPAWAPSAAARAAGLAAWAVPLDENVTPASLPPRAAADGGALSIARLALRGEYEPFCVAMRPVTNLGPCTVECAPFAGPGRLAATAAVVHYKPARGFESIAYRLEPDTLRPDGVLDLRSAITREVVVTVCVPTNAAPGLYRGALVLRDARGGERLRVGLDLDVRDAVLRRETAFRMGFFGLMPPELVPAERQWDVLEQTLELLRQHGMNAVCGGPGWRLTGWREGQPQLDTGDADRFFALLRRHGFDGPVNAYGASFGGLHERYTTGEAAARVARESGLAYEEAFDRAWTALDRHARGAGWPTILYAMCDETRVREQAERELPFMQLMGRVSARHPATVRTSGAYSVAFDRRPADPADLLYWHQRFFEALDISCLNGHDATVMAEAARRGREIQIYNQGRTRYSFGLYQWSEFRKGVRARWQWHLNVLHGYAFFDLDGREPDTAMIVYGRRGLYPTLGFERCREGAEEFYLLQTLHDAAPAGGAAGWLAALVAPIAVNQREPPAGYDPDAIKRTAVEWLERVRR